jgi:hypothetical protein
VAAYERKEAHFIPLKEAADTKFFKKDLLLACTLSRVKILNFNL